MKLRIKHRPDGKAFLHTWRTGQIYFEKNRDSLIGDWTNMMHKYYCHHIDNAGILTHDSRRGIPADDDAFDAIYSCHVIEHLDLAEAASYLSELFRVLKPGGVCRISTPDLGREAREYVRQLDRCLENPSEEADRQYDLSLRALIDQFARKRAGGELLAHFRSARLDKAYAFSRYGDVYREFLTDPVPELVGTQSRPATRRFIAPRWKYVFDKIKLGLIGRITRRDPRYTGELELWEWDEYSLGRSLKETGFHNVKTHTYDSSLIPDWEKYQLDTSFDNKTPIECSLYMEAEK